MTGQLSSPAFRDRGGYAMACGIVRSLEKQLLDDDRLGELLAAEDDGAVLGLLKRWGWIPGDVADGAPSLPAAVEASLLLSDRRLAALGADSPCTALLLLRFEMQNLAAALKAGNGGNPLPDLHSRGVSDRSSLERMAAGGAFSAYPGVLAERLDERRGAFEGSDPAVGEAVFSAWHDALLEAAQAERSDLLVDYLRHRTDLNNITTTVRRLRHRRLWGEPALLPGGMIAGDDLAAVGSTAELARLLEKTVYGPLFFRSRDDGGEILPRRLEQETDDFLTAVMQPAKYVALGPEALWGYRHGREVDAGNIRAITAGRIAGGGEDGPASRLRRPYV